MKCCSISRSDMTFGWPSTSASRIVPKVDCICVCLYSRFSTISGTASRLSSMTIRIPSRSDSSRRSRMSVSFLSRTSCAICSIRRDLFTMKGISVTTIRSVFASTCSISARARITMRPRPVR